MKDTVLNELFVVGSDHTYYKAYATLTQMVKIEDCVYAAYDEGDELSESDELIWGWVVE